MHFTRTILAATLAAATLAVHAESTNLDPVVVTATRTETPLSELPIPVVVIDRATIERNAGASLPDLLRLAAGVEIAQSGGPGQLATAFLRGTDSDHVLVLVDGVELSPGSIGTPQLQNIDPAIIERIEIVKGPRSSLYGSEAVGGVINIITRRDVDSIRAHLGGGSFGSTEFGAGGSIGSGETALDVDVARRSSDGFPPLAGSDIDRGYDNTSANLRLRSTLGPLAATLRHYQGEGTTEYLDSMLAPAAQDFENRVSELQLTWDIAAWQSIFSVSEARDLLAQVGSTSFADTDRSVVDWQNNFVTDAHTVTAGLYFENEDVVAENFGRTEADTDVRAIYLQDQWLTESFDLLLAGRSTDHERFGQQFSWNVDAGWHVNESWRLRANVGRAFRAPNATFLFGPFGANADLQPEVSLNREIGVAWQATERQRFTLAAFRNHIDDMIDFDLLTFTYQNIAEVEITGVELGHEWQADDWQGHASLVWQQPENALTGEPLLRRAEEVLTMGVQRRFESVNVGVDLVASGERADVDSATFLTITEPGYALLNFTASWWISPSWSLSGRIENVLDAEYETASGYNTADRGAFLTLRYTQ